MMPVYGVFIQDLRWWIDSLWIEQASADRRVVDLKDTMSALGNTTTKVWVRALRIQDAVLAKANKIKDAA